MSTDRKPARLDGDAIREARVLSELSRRRLAHKTDIRIAQLVQIEQGAVCERLTLGALSRLAHALDVEPASLLATERPIPQSPAEDDVRIEALLAEVGKGMNRDDLAYVLGWDLERTQNALDALATRLAATGQRLTPLKFGWYRLAPSHKVMTRQERAAVGRTALGEYGPSKGHAKVLASLLRPDGAERAVLPRHKHEFGHGRSSITALIAAGLVGSTERGVALTEAVAFSLCAEPDVPTVPGTRIRPQMRLMRARYTPTP